MNISIESLSPNQNGIEYTWSNNGGDESEIEKMSKEDFAKLLCEHSDDNYIFNDEMNHIIAKQSIQISEDEYSDDMESITEFTSQYLKYNIDYCKECLIKFIESQNKN